MSNNNPYQTKRKSSSNIGHDRNKRVKITSQEESKISSQEESKVSASKSPSFQDVVPKSSALDGLSVQEIEAILAMKRMKENPDPSIQQVRCNGCGMTMEKSMTDFHTCPTNNRLKMAAIAVKTTEEWDSDDEIKAASTSLKQHELMTTEGQMYADATAYSKRHGNRRDKMLARFSETCADLQGDLGTLAELIQDPNAPGSLIPKALVSLGGEVTMWKCNLASDILWHLMKEMVNTQAKEGDCPYLQPSTEYSYLRSLLGLLSEEYDWRYQYESHFSFKGGLKPKMELLHAERKKKYPTYGTGPNKQRPSVLNASEVDVSVFDESDIEEHQKKTLLVMGINFAMRGLTEHAYCQLAQLVEEKYEASHPLAGRDCIKLTGLTDKSHKITSTRPITRDTKNANRIPFDINDMNSPGGSIVRLKRKAAPGQVRLYTYPLTDSQKRTYLRNNMPNVETQANKPIGVNKIAKMMKSACDRVGLDCSGHGLRAISVTTAANAAGLSEEARLAFSRHTSIASQRPYQRPDDESEMTRLEAFGLVKDDASKKKKKKKKRSDVDDDEN